jgi:hypothetical protein
MDRSHLLGTLQYTNAECEAESKHAELAVRVMTEVRTCPISVLSHFLNRGNQDVVQHLREMCVGQLIGFLISCFIVTLVVCAMVPMLIVQAQQSLQIL